MTNDIEVRELGEVQKLYRAVFSDAVHDLGYGTPAQRGQVETWMTHDTFDICCSLAEWDPGWVRDLLRSIMAIDGPVRKPIVKDCLKIMRGVVRVTGRSEIVSVGIGGPVSVLEEEAEMKYIGGPMGKLSKASRGMHRLRSEASGDTE
jgi:hypothetical protein